MAAVPQSIASQGQPFEVEQIGVTIGAEIHGIDLTQPLDDTTFQRLEAALIEHKVIYARNQDLAPEQHVALGKRFGELEVHPFHRFGEAPQLMVLDNHKDNPVLSTDVWHSDTTFASARPDTRSCAPASARRLAATLCGPTCARLSTACPIR